MRDPLRGHELFLDVLLEKTASQIISTISCPHNAVVYKTIGDDGYSNIERLEMSPLPDDQVLALGFRLAGGVGDQESIEDALRLHFKTPAPSILIEAQRHVVMQSMGSLRVPFGEVEQDAKELESRIDEGNGAESKDPSKGLENYAALLADLWCDPRLYTPVRTRRKMLALISACRKRLPPCLDDRSPASLII